MGITIALFGVFALLLVVLAGAAIRVFAARDASGRAQPLGCAAGCALGLFLAALGVAGLVAFLLALGIQTAARSIPFESVTVLRDSGHAARLPVTPDPWRPLHLVFEVPGHDTPVHELIELVHRLSEGQSSARAEQSENEDGNPVTYVDVALPASDNDLRELERELRKILPHLRLENGVRVEFKGARRDW